MNLALAKQKKGMVLLMQFVEIHWHTFLLVGHQRATYE